MDAVVERIRERLYAEGHRYTGPRDAVIRALAAAEGPVNADALADEVRARRVDRSSVYRTLGLLVELGLARRVEFAEGAARFELAEPFIDHHHHLVCTVCGRIDELPGCDLESIHRIVSRRSGYSIEAHRLDFFGTCPTCRRGAGGVKKA
ncbi:MAG TPA: Fur family transcriptional regulator [Thermodesulfobacteriota bacterium]